MYFMREVHREMSARFVENKTMNKENKSFIIILCLAAIMVLGVISQNVVSAIKPKKAKLVIDVEKVRQEIESARLIPKEAMHWKNIH